MNAHAISDEVEMCCREVEETGRWQTTDNLSFDYIPIVDRNTVWKEARKSLDCIGR